MSRDRSVGHVDDIVVPLALEASLARIAELDRLLAASDADRAARLDAVRVCERAIVERDARLAANRETIARLEAADQDKEDLQEVRQAIALLQTQSASRLASLNQAESTIATIEADRAARLQEIHRLSDEVLRLRAEAALPLAARIMRRLTKRTPVARPQTSSAGADVATTEAGFEAPETAVFRAMSTERGLWRCVRRGLRVETVIDVGASNGMWSAACERQLPQARYLLVEAQSVHRDALERYCDARSNAEFVLAAAGRHEGEIWFDDSDPFGGLASERPSETMKRKVPVVTLDAEIARRQLKGPFLVKLDVHGFEVPILEGATGTLSDAALVVIECYTFRIADGSLLFDEMVRWMRDRGFGVLDASEPLWRARDACLWQMDLFFQPLARPEFAARTWT